MATATEPQRPPRVETTGSLSRRMILVAAAWIMVLLTGGGYMLDRVLTSAVTRNFDDQLSYVLRALILSAEIGPDGEVMFNRPAADQRFLEPYSGLYWQVSGAGHEDFPSRSLWDRQLKFGDATAHTQIYAFDSNQFATEKLRILEQDVKLPGSNTRWRFQVAESRDGLNDQIGALRRTLVRSFLLLGVGLIVMAALQTLYGLWPLRKVRLEIAQMRAGRASRIEKPMPIEVVPMVD